MHTLYAQKIHLTNTRDLTTLATEVARPRALPNTYMLASSSRCPRPPSARWMVAAARRDNGDNDKSNKEKMKKEKKKQKRKLHHTNGKQRVKERASRAMHKENYMSRDARIRASGKFHHSQ